MDWMQFGPMTPRMLLSCFLVGVVVGLLFDMVCGVGRAVQRKILFLLDVTLGPLFSIITFFASLVITDGNLYPLLFTGLLFGFLVEHMTVGRGVSWGVSQLLRLLKSVEKFVRRVMGRCNVKLADLIKPSKRVKNSKKDALF